MERWQCVVLEQNKQLIVDNIDSKRLLDAMVQAGIFTTDDDDEIRSNNTRKASAEKFYEKLLHSKHKDAYTTFKTALNENDTNYIVTALEKLEKKYETHQEVSLPDPQKIGGRGASSTGNSVYVCGNRNTVITGSKNVNVNITRR